MTDTLELVDLSLLEDEADEICCESILHQREHRPSHAADWYSIAACGKVMAVCTQRRTLCRHHGNWLCAGQGSCNARHAFDEIQWEPVKP